MMSYVTVVMLYSFTSASLAASPGYWEIIPFRRAVTTAACFCAWNRSPKVWHISTAECGDSKALKIQHSPLLSSQLWQSRNESQRHCRLHDLRDESLPWDLSCVCGDMSCLLRVVWSPQWCGTQFCVLFFSREPCLSFSPLSLPNVGWQQRRVERKLGCEQSPFPKSPPLHGRGNSYWITWLVRVGFRLLESHPDSKHTVAASQLCKACILKWSRSQQAINLFLKWWQC